MERIDLYIPDGWDDVTAGQLRTIAEIQCLGLSRKETLVALFLRLSGVKMKHNGDYVTADGRTFRMESWQLADFCGRLAWAMDETPDTLPNPTGVDGYLRDMTFGDWFETDTQIRMLPDATAFNQVKRLLKIHRETDDADVMIVRAWWNCVSASLAAKYPLVLTGGENNGEYDPFSTLQNMYLMLNDDHPQENARINDANVHDVLSALENKVRKARETERQLKKHK